MSTNLEGFDSHLILLVFEITILEPLIQSVVIASQPHVGNKGTDTQISSLYT